MSTWFQLSEQTTPISYMFRNVEAYPSQVGGKESQTVQKKKIIYIYMIIYLKYKPFLKILEVSAYTVFWKKKKSFYK